MSHGDPSILVTRPIALTILALAVFTTITAIRRQRAALRIQAGIEASASEKGGQSQPE
jgi:TctA family transporter